MTVRIPLVDVGLQFRENEEEWLPEIVELLRSGRYVGGEPVARFERAFAEYVGVKHAIGVGSGADALRLTLLALGLRPGDRVATVSHTFVSTADAIVHAGGRPRFVEIDPATYGMDPADLARKMDPAVRAIVPVHLYGQPVDLDPIREVAARWGVPVLEDAAQSHGARYRGRRVGGIGEAGAFSFYPAKNLGALGDGGAVTTNDGAIAERLRLLRDNGAAEKYRHVLVGFNSRLDSVQAVVLRAKLAHLDEWNARRRALAAGYRARLSEIPGVTLPGERSETEPVYHLFVVRLGSPTERESLRGALERQGIETGIHYPRAVHQQAAYATVDWDGGPLPVTESVPPVILSLPIYPEMAPRAVDEVADRVAGWRRGG